MNEFTIGSARWTQALSWLSIKQREVEEQLLALRQADPVMSDGLAETVEDGVMSWKEEVHTNITALRRSLLSLSNKIKQSLNKLHLGTYGKCEKCGNLIWIL